MAGEALGNTQAGHCGGFVGGQVRLQVLLPSLVQHLRQVRHLVPRGPLPARTFDFVKLCWSVVKRFLNYKTVANTD